MLTLLFLELKLIFCSRQNTEFEIFHVESRSTTLTLYDWTQKNLIEFTVIY